MKAWVARDKNDELWLYENKPKKVPARLWGLAVGVFQLSSSMFPQVKWEDEEPTEVEVTIKIKKKKANLKNYEQRRIKANQGEL